MGHRTSAAAPAAGVEDAVGTGEGAEMGGEEVGLCLFQTVQFGGDPVSAHGSAVSVPAPVPVLVEYRPVDVPDAVVVVVEVVDLSEFEVDRVLLGVTESPMPSPSVMTPMTSCSPYLPVV
jgi:hypothetical protein